MKNYVQQGDVLSLTAPYAVASGAGFKVGSIFAVAAGAAGNGAPVEGVTVGVFDLTKTSAQAWTTGAPIFWDDTAKECTTDDNEGGNIRIGVAAKAASNPSATGSVRLNGSF